MQNYSKASSLCLSLIEVSYISAFQILCLFKMFNNENLELFGSMLKFMNKVKVVLFSWDETKKSIVIKDSLFRRFCSSSNVCLFH